MLRESALYIPLRDQAGHATEIYRKTLTARLVGVFGPVFVHNADLHSTTPHRWRGWKGMSDNIVEFPPRASSFSLEGPYEVFNVLVDGRRIPRLTGKRTEDGLFNFIVDDRFMGGPFTEADAEQVAYLLAQSLAVGAGYSSLEADLPGRCFAPVVRSLGEMPEEPSP